MTDPTRFAERFDRSALLRELEAAGCDVSRPGAIRCPWHDDRSVSAAIYQRDDGAWAYHCHAGGCAKDGDVYDVRKWRGGEAAPVQSRQHDPLMSQPARTFDSLNAAKAHYGDVVDVYVYGADKPTMAVFRVEPPGQPKSFRQLSPTHDGKWAATAPPKPWPLYNQKRLAAADRIVVVEGERCVHALHNLGIVATTSPGGANNAANADWSPLSGKRVVLWPDHDDAGRKYADAVAAALEAFPGCKVQRIDPANLGVLTKGDAVDFIAICEREQPGSARLVIDTLLDTADEVGAEKDLAKWFADIAAGKVIEADWPWESVRSLTQALLPGAVTMLVGAPGSAKSLLLLQAVRHWNDNGIPASVMEMEEGRRYHLQRGLAQIASCSGLTRLSWVAQNGELAQELVKQHAEDVARLARAVHAPDSANVTLSDVGEWVRAEMKRGKRVVCVDPISSATTADRSWADELTFINTVKKAAQEYGASAVLVIHPKKNPHGDTLDDMAGGAAYQRLSSTALWLSNIAKPEHRSVRVRTHYGNMETVDADRFLTIRKARNGPGTGKKIALAFDVKSLTLRELGVVEDDG